MRFYKSKTKKTMPAPRLGQHTKEILAELEGHPAKRKLRD
jgi:crotonobetainyl-CoA:carnitine CoA-transferase CaiB-like acyl-CoA transferase